VTDTEDAVVALADVVDGAGAGQHIVDRFLFGLEADLGVHGQIAVPHSCS
jgi:hypothetical protein